MSPIDDELRAALHDRARVVNPSPDPLAGIEARARRIQRNRVGAAVAGSALAVALVAAVVPAVQSATTTQPDLPRVASAEPRLSQAPDSSAYALDPQDPWDYRGIPVEQLGQGTVETVEREYATKRRARTVRLTPLFGQVYEPSQQVELVFLAEVDGTFRWGVAQSSEGGPEFLWDEELPSPALALAAALPGDEAPRLLVVAAPSTGGAVYAAQGTSYDPMTDLDAGVFVTAIAPGDTDDRYQVLDEDGDLDSPVFEGPAPDVTDAG